MKKSFHVSHFTFHKLNFSKNWLSTFYFLLFTGALALFIYMPFHIFLSQWLSTFTGGLSVWKVCKDVFTALLFVVLVCLVFYSHKQARLYGRLLILLGAYGVIHLILFFSTNQPLETGLLAMAYNLRIFAYLMIGYSLALLAPKADLTKKFLRLLILLSTIVCFIALIQWFLPKDILEHFGYSVARGVKPNFFIDDKPDLPRVFSTLRDPNSLGAFLILPIVFLAQKLRQHWKSDKKMFIAGLLLLHVWVLLLTFSRSTLLATLVAIGSLIAVQNLGYVKQNKQKLAIFSVSIIALIFGFVYMFRDQYFVQNTVFHADESTTLQTPNELRASLAQKAVDGIIEQPLGHGPGTAGLVSTRLPDGLLSENYFLQILYEVGIFGFIVFMAILYLIWKNLWSNRQNPTAAVLLASFIGLLFANLFFHTWSNEAVSIAFFLLAGVAIGKPKVKLS